jgi:hypothetical protein
VGDVVVHGGAARNKAIAGRRAAAAFAARRGARWAIRRGGRFPRWRRGAGERVEAGLVRDVLHLIQVVGKGSIGPGPEIVIARGSGGTTRARDVPGPVEIQTDATKDTRECWTE